MVRNPKKPLNVIKLGLVAKIKYGPNQDSSSHHEKSVQQILQKAVCDQLMEEKYICSVTYSCKS
jgi:hypothetical protein